MKKKKKRLGVPALLIIYFCLGVIAIAAVMSLIWSYAEAYEDSQSINAVNSYMYYLNTDPDFLRSNIEESSDTPADGFLSDEEYYSTVAGRVLGTLSFSRQYTTDGAGNISYSIYSSDALLGSITLAQDFENGRHDLYPWRVTGVSFDWSYMLRDYSFTLPSDFIPVLDGREVPEKYVSDNFVEYSGLEYCSGITPSVPHKVSYTVTGLFEEPKLTMLRPTGEEFAYNPDAGDIQFLLVSDADVYSRLYDFTDSFVRCYLTFSSGINTNTGNLAPYIIPGSELESRLSGAVEGLFWHTTYSLSFDEFELKEAVDIGEGYYSVLFRVKVTPNGRADLSSESLYRAIICEYGGMSDLRVADIENC